MSRRPYAMVAVVTVRDQEYPDPRPVSFVYRGGRVRVARVIERWLEAGRWWEREPESVAWRVEAVGGGVYELLMRRTNPPQWILTGIYD